MCCWKLIVLVGWLVIKLSFVSDLSFNEERQLHAVYKVSVLPDMPGQWVWAGQSREREGEKDCRLHNFSTSNGQAIEYPAPRFYCLVQHDLLQGLVWVHTIPCTRVRCAVSAWGVTIRVAPFVTFRADACTPLILESFCLDLANMLSSFMKLSIWFYKFVCKFASKYIYFWSVC